jgi:hypothetical protein
VTIEITYLTGNLPKNITEGSCFITLQKASKITMRTIRIALAVIAAVFSVQVCAAAQAGGEGEVESLKRRIEELEKRNRAMQELLVELKARLDLLSQPGVASETSRLPQPVKVSASMSQAKVRTSMATQHQPDAVSDEQKAAVSTSQPSTVEAAQTPAQPKPATGGEAARWSELISGENKFKLYGFLRLDLDIDSQRPNNPQLPLFITSADPRIGKAGAGNFSAHPRLTRFGVDYTGPKIAVLGDAKLSGKLETDFENGGSESRQIIRIRHAYLKLDWGDFSVLAGQTWDIFSPLFPTVNNDTLMWNAGNVGDRRPQFRIAYEPESGRGRWSLIAGVGLTGAIDGQDLDNNGFRDGEESGRPDVQARIGYSHPLWVKDQSASIGISGVYQWLNTSRPVTSANLTSFRSQLINIDYTIPIFSRASLRGEGWWGHNMGDLRGGAGQSINSTSGRQIRGRGGWTELSLKLSRYWSLHPGFTTDDPVDEDVPVGGRTRNRSFYFANRFTPGGNFTIGADYLRWKTNYKGFSRGLDNRVNIFFQYSF